VTTPSTILERAEAEFGRMTRGGRIIIMLGGGLLLLLLWSELLSPISDGWAASADTIEAQVDRVDRATAQAAAQRSNVIAFGPMASPNQRSTESQDMLEAVNQIMSEWGIRNYEFNESSNAVKVASARLPGIERIKATLRFEAEVEKAIEIIGAIEDSPAIEAINTARVQVGKSDRQLDIELTIEAWVRGGRKR